MVKKYSIKDYTKRYHSIMVFDKNKDVFIHRWYPFVEGYSLKFIDSILNELPYSPKCALEPFSGSGTTPLQLQNRNIKCYSFEVSPFMYLLNKTKLKNDYNIKLFQQYKRQVFDILNTPINNIRNIETIPFGRTVSPNKGLTKWNFNDDVLDAILNIKHAIRQVDNEDYKNLFHIALASIILKVSNLFRNGKCLSYKKKWKENALTYAEVINSFEDKLNTTFQEDISIISNKKDDLNIKNDKYCYFGDVRKKITVVPDKSIDLIITSPPYLNSRDYTDIYMLELKVLDLIKNYSELQALRKSTLHSHVQVKYADVPIFNNERLIYCIKKMEKASKDFHIWNSDIIQMINGYFNDMNILFQQFNKKMEKGGKIYFNVANSAYYNVKIPVDLIISDIAEDCGFHVEEIRKARDLSPSPQQAKYVGKLRESVIIISA